MTTSKLPTAGRPESSGTGLAAELASLGHRCTGRCISAVDELNARVWFTRRRAITDGRPAFVLVVVDKRQYHGPWLRSIQLLRQINGCTTGDGIHVSARRAGDNGHALAALQWAPIKAA